MRPRARERLPVPKFIDDILTVNKNRFHEVLDRMRRERFEGVTLSCTQGMRADACDLEMLQKMKDVGFEFLGFGVESGSERMLQTIKKGETLEEIDAAISNACKVGFEVGLFFIIGMPNETAEDVEKNVKPLLSASFAKLDLATREELDVQAKVLARTREKLSALEARVAALEASLKQK